MKASCSNDDKLETETKRNHTQYPRAYYLNVFDSFVYLNL